MSQSLSSRMVLWSLLLACLSCTLARADEATEAQVSQEFRQRVRPFLNEYCLACHEGTEPSGDRDFSSLTGEIADDNALVDLQDILDQLNLSEMPPSDATQPTSEERRLVVEWLSERIARYAEERSATSEVVLRRLNAREYRNVIRDLFGFPTLMFDPTVKFPADQQSEHLDNLGDTLVTSGFLLSSYLDAGETILNKAMYPLRQPAVQTWRFEDHFDQQPEIDQVHRSLNGFKHLTLYDVIGADKHEGAYAPIHQFEQGVPYDGWYDIRFDATALNREHPYEDAYLGRDRREPFRLGIRAGRKDAGTLHLPQPNEPLLADVELADGTERYKVRVWLDEGFTPRFTFRNGLMDARTLWTQVQRRYPDLFPKTGKGIVAMRKNAIRHGKLPQIQVDNIEIQGPYYDAWPRASQQALLGDDWIRAVELDEQGQGLDREATRRHLVRLLERCYRRPVEAVEVERVLGLIESRRALGKSYLEAYGEGVLAILCSPNFLYWGDSATGSEDNQEAETAGVIRISPSALAQRLSAFLWSSMPDDGLQSELQAKLGGQAPDSRPSREELAVLVDRMLANPKSDAFVEDFLDSWLTLRDLGSQPPDRGQFRAYYQYQLRSAMLQETRLFTRHLLDENLSIGNFIDSEFSFLNKRLAALYGEPIPEGLLKDPTKFQKVRLQSDGRGGLLGHASVLTVSANGIDTSPVVRGVWVLENLLGTPPSPPPPDVEPLDPDVRGAKTIRQQLDKHRSVESCNGCHRRIDPIGFALENFGPIGGWREYYDKRRKLPVDSAGQLPNGKKFADVAELKQILAEHPEVVSRSLTSKLMAYALGRHLGPADRPAIDEIAEQHRRMGYGFRDLIHLVVQSEMFLQP